MIRYTTFGGGIGRYSRRGMTWWPAYSISTPKRVPAPVRALLTGATGTVEVDWDPKTRVATLVPIWERYHL